MADNQQSTPDSAGIDRTPTGQIASQTQTTDSKATTPQTSTTPETPPAPPSDEPKSLINEDGKSLANQKPPEAPKGAPETYESFKVPDGFQLDEEVSKQASGIFKSMNLSQNQAQELVDFYIQKTNESMQAPFDLWHKTQQEWVSQVRADPFLGPRLNQVTSTIAKGIEMASQGNPKLAESFRQVMDVTGAGNNPAFIRMFYEMASRLTEGGHVAGRGPSPAGQRSDGQRTSAARAMYPNLP